MSDQTFDKADGLPANQHAKKLAKQDSARKQKKKEFKQFFTIKDGKILSIKVNERGAYSSYVNKKSKLTKEEYASQVAKWKKDNLWVAEEDFDTHVELLIEEMKK